MLGRSAAKECEREGGRERDCVDGWVGGSGATAKGGDRYGR